MSRRNIHNRQYIIRARVPLVSHIVHRIARNNEDYQSLIAPHVHAETLRPRHVALFSSCLSCIPCLTPQSAVRSPLPHVALSGKAKPFARDAKSNERPPAETKRPAPSVSVMSQVIYLFASPRTLARTSLESLATIMCLVTPPCRCLTVSFRNCRALC